MALTFSVANPENIDALCQLVNFAYRGEFSRLGWTTEADLLQGQRTDPQMLRDLMTPPDQVILTGADPDYEGRLVGCVHLKKISPETCQLGLLTVKPDLQNKGVGRQLLEESEAWARSWSCKEMNLLIIQTRREMIDWYVRRGYKLTGDKKDFPYGDLRFGIPTRDDLYFLGMKKTLST